jgi:ABC-type sugar transport system ATPase subunit
LALSTRILVVRDGRIVGELSRGAATPERLLRLMSGVEDSRGAIQAASGQ